jgi:hypothetical protein
MEIYINENFGKDEKSTFFYVVTIKEQHVCKRPLRIGENNSNP